MKVTQNNSPIQLDAYLRQIKQQRSLQSDTDQASVSLQTGTDTVKLSLEARKVQQAAQIQSQAGDIREEKVRQIRMDIEKGTYQVNGGQVATDMLRESFENEKIMKKIDTRA